MRSLASRIDRLARRLGADAPGRVVIYYGSRFTRHEIHRAGDMVTFGVPCPRDADPMEHLSPVQRRLIGPAYSVACFEAAENPRDPPGSFEERMERLAELEGRTDMHKRGTW
jgi:hypothetical protein